jgi:hypothetical protein
MNFMTFGICGGGGSKNGNNCEEMIFEENVEVHHILYINRSDIIELFYT